MDHRHVDCLTACPQLIPKQVIHTVRSSAFPFNSRYFIFSLRSPSNCLKLLPRLPVASVLPSIMCFWKQVLSKMWPIQLAFLHLTLCSPFLSSLTISNTSFSHDRSNVSPPSMDHISTNMLLLLEEYSQNTQFHRSLTIVYDTKVGMKVFFPPLNVAFGRVSYPTHRLATHSISTRIIGAPISQSRVFSTAAVQNSGCCGCAY
jgi:hypothetical protein